MAHLNEWQERLCDESPWDYSDLRALFINCTLKRSPEVSHTQGLADLSIAIMERNGVSVDSVRAIDHDIATGVWPDMTEHGWERDEWPEIFERVMAADILVLTTPIWLGEKSSVCTQVIERLYGNSHLLNENGQYAYYGRVAGCMVTGNEDGAKHCSMNALLAPATATDRRRPLLLVGRGLREPATGMGRRLPFRLRKPGVPLSALVSVGPQWKTTPFFSSDCGPATRRPSTSSSLFTTARCGASRVHTYERTPPLRTWFRRRGSA